MELILTGKIIAVLPEQKGISKQGNEWMKQEYVIEQQDQYHKKVCFQIFGADKISNANIQAGDDLKVYCDVESREYQGRWFTNVNAWKVEKETAPQFGAEIRPEDVAPINAIEATPATNNTTENQLDDLPF